MAKKGIIRKKNKAGRYQYYDYDNKKAASVNNWAAYRLEKRAEKAEREAAKREAPEEEFFYIKSVLTHRNFTDTTKTRLGDGTGFEMHLTDNDGKTTIYSEKRQNLINFSNVMRKIWRDFEKLLISYKVKNVSPDILITQYDVPAKNTAFADMRENIYNF